MVLWSLSYKVYQECARYHLLAIQETRTAHTRAIQRTEKDNKFLYFRGCVEHPNFISTWKRAINNLIWHLPYGRPEAGFYRAWWCVSRLCIVLVDILAKDNIYLFYNSLESYCFAASRHFLSSDFHSYRMPYTSQESLCFPNIDSLARSALITAMRQTIAQAITEQ